MPAIARARGADELKRERLRALGNAGRRLDRRLEALGRVSARFSWLRLAVFAAALVSAGFAYEFLGPAQAAVVLLAGFGAFAAAVIFHRRVERRLDCHRLYRRLRAEQLARANLDWDALPPPRPFAPRPEHPFEADLSLVGPRSLHHLLDVAVSLEGSDRLRQWLTSPEPDREQTLARQRLVRELVPRRRFRDRLTLAAALAADDDRDWRAGDLLAWLQRHSREDGLGRWLLLLGGLAALDAALFAANLAGWLPPWWRVSLVVYLGLTFARSRRGASAWEEATALQGALRQLRSVFQHLEEHDYRHAPALRAHCAPFLDHARRPSAYLRRLGYYVAALALRGNPVIYFALNAVVPWELTFVHLLERYRAELAPHARRWMDVWFDLEALGSLATAAHLNPGDAFPELPLVSDPSAGVFSAEALGHPLIPPATRVVNDFVAPALGQVTLISGSNMAGKSVFLKSVAVNLVLAHAGGTVCARRLRTVPFRLFTSMAIGDSVTGGYSYFYAEVRRLKDLLDELEREHSLPLLYCIDEIFRGTNNRERLLGARAYVRAIAGKRGVGLIATHDLDLTRLADEEPRVVNYHFRDHVEGDRMVFDYLLRSGPSPTTNALRLMRLQGLPVPDAREEL